MSVALDSNRISHFPSQAAGGGAVDSTVRAASRRSGHGWRRAAPVARRTAAPLSLKDKDKQGSAFPLTPRDRHSILAPRASPPFGAPIQLTWVLVDAMQIRTLCSEGRSCRDLAAVLADWPAWLAPISAQEVRGNVQVIS